jgi:hypothetical protein
MSRIRTIKPDFWSSEQVMACSRSSRLLFIGLWNFCDDAGRHVDSAKTIKAQLFPGDDDIDSSSVRGMIDELSSNGLLQKYEVDGRAYLQVTGWDHQRIDKPRPSKLPGPKFDDHSTNVRRPFAPDPILSEGKGGDRTSPHINSSFLTAARARAIEDSSQNKADGPATALPTGAPSRPPVTTNGEAKQESGLPRKEGKQARKSELPQGTIVGPEVLR